MSGSLLFGNTAVTLVLGNIADQEADAIVNAANASLAGGGGVDGAIHRRGGGAIMAETDRLYPRGCPTGSAVVSGAGNLDARFVIHAVAPRYSAGRSDSASLLAGAYARSLELAVERGCHRVAFPSLGTGAYRYPLAEAAEIALTTVRDFLARRGGEPEFPLTEIRFVLFDSVALSAFQAAADSLV